eukprot:GHVS01019860.1.p1 GENE.GHVS01019860.1~~GHVS01019860.1.p1  ORF type:complete len:168 (+),score=17.64 GHVS01019860.1:315-818(+)
MVTMAVPFVGFLESERLYPTVATTHVTTKLTGENLKSVAIQYIVPARSVKAPQGNENQKVEFVLTPPESVDSNEQGGCYYFNILRPDAWAVENIEVVRVDGERLKVSGWADAATANDRNTLGSRGASLVEIDCTRQESRWLHRWDKQSCKAQVEVKSDPEKPDVSIP